MRGSESWPSSMVPISSRKVSATRFRWYTRDLGSAMAILPFPVQVNPIGYQRSRGSAFDVVPPRVENLRAQFPDHSCRGLLNFFHLAAQVISRTGDRHDPDRCALPGDGLVQFGNRHIEALAKLVFQRTHHLPPILERVGVFDANFKR